MLVGLWAVGRLVACGGSAAGVGAASCPAGMATLQLVPATPRLASHPLPHSSPATWPPTPCSQIRCQGINYTSSVYEDFLDLSLEINKAPSLSKALQHFTAVEVLDGENRYRCPKNNKLVSCKEGAWGTAQLVLACAAAGAAATQRAHTGAPVGPKHPPHGN